MSDPSITQDLRHAVMPDFLSGDYAFAHDVHSALACLAQLNVPANRIHIKSAGWHSVPEGSVVGQRPAPGASLEGPITLEVAGPSFHHSLPVAMWESGGEAEPGTRELLEVFDDPLQKLRHWMHEGGSLLRISPDNLAACARWMMLFGLNLEDWAPEHWYNLVLLLLDLPTLERGESGIRRALERVPGLPLKAASFQPSLALLEEKNISHLGSHASRLGVDLIVGDAIEDLAHLRIVIGPVELEIYDRYATGNGKHLLDQVLALILPFHLDYEIRWVVLDAERAPQLGFAECNGRLGINSYLGEKAEMR